MADIRVGIIGAGYIANWHADAIRATKGARLVAVCDRSDGAARAFAETYGVTAYTSVDALLDSRAIDAVHITTPPDSHVALATRCLEAGLHVMVEKPVALKANEAAQLVRDARNADRILAAGHNFLGLPSYQRLKALVDRNGLGRISSAEVHWHLPLAPLRSGPYGLWLLRDPRNLLLELGPHLVAFAQNLFGDVAVHSLQTSRDIELPGMGSRPQAFRVLARAGNVDVNFHISLMEVADDRSVVLRGSAGTARLDYANDTLVTRIDNASDLVVNPARAALAQGWGHLREGAVNAARQTLSLNKQSPYALSFRGASAAFYGAIQGGSPLDTRFNAKAAVSVSNTLDHMTALLPGDAVYTPPVQTRGPKPKTVVIGGTGFIGRHLTRGLAARGQDVRVLSRGKFGPFGDLPDNVEICPVALNDPTALARAFNGIETVYNLAKSLDTTWAGALKNDVGVTEIIASACRDAGVERLVYTGTIASYDMSDPSACITEATGFSEDMTDRNLYARSKAECEKRLMKMHQQGDLPVSIARPGIVIGPGGPLQHWGIGRWHGAGALRLWGNGRNILPFVLIDDVVDGLIATAENPQAMGEDFNLVGEPMLTGRNYFDAIASELDAQMRVTPGNLHMMWATDAIKYALKRQVLGRKGAVRASLKDWQSRAHLAPFDNTKPKELLGWSPEPDKAAFIRRGITEAGLFGF